MDRHARDKLMVFVRGEALVIFLAQPEGLGTLDLQTFRAEGLTVSR